MINPDLIFILARPQQYLGPETVMPLTSIFAALLGFVLIFWRLIIKFIRKLFRRITGKQDVVEPGAEETPVTESVSSDPSQQDE